MPSLLHEPAGATAAVLGDGRYRLIERIRVGGMGTVHRAWDHRFERTVAVKLISDLFVRDPTFVRRFHREAELCARVAHPNVVALLDTGVEPRDFIVMELVDGVDARALLQRRGPLAEREAVDLLVQVCDALVHVHAHGVLHRDVSLANVLVRRRDGRAKLADFGLAAPSNETPRGEEATIIGTPGYAAPELLWGARPSVRSDLYSLAVVAYRLLAGRGPQDHAATLALATAAARMAPLSAARPELPRGLVEAIGKALAEDPVLRHASVAEFREELLAGAGGEAGVLARAA